MLIILRFTLTAIMQVAWRPDDRQWDAQFYGGGKFLKGWSKTMEVIALSSGEAELGGLTRACAEGLGSNRFSKISVSMSKSNCYQMQQLQ